MKTADILIVAIPPMYGAGLNEASAVKYEAELSVIPITRPLRGGIAQ